jgi:hypothetical protein
MKYAPYEHTILSWYQSRFNTTKVIRIREFLEVYMVRTYRVFSVQSREVACLFSKIV